MNAYDKMREVRDATVATLWQCRKCGRWFCAYELNEHALCGDRAGEEEE